MSLLTLGFVASAAGHNRKVQGPAADGWTAYKTSYCSFTAMKGAQVEANADGVKIGNPGGQLFVFVAPYFADHNVTASEFMQQAAALYSAELPNAKLTDSAPIDAGKSYSGCKAKFSFGQGMTAEAECVGNGKAGTFYCIAAPTDQFGLCKKFLLITLESFKFLGPLPKSSEGSAEIATTTWTDPREGAFSVSVPEGWKVTGGLFRLAVNDVRPEIKATSPDGQITVQMGDRDIPPHALPNRMLAMAHLGQGSIYDTGYGVKMLVAPYATGQKFAEQYASKIMQRCQNGRITASNNRPDVANRLQSLYRGYVAGMSLAYTSGDAFFTGSVGNGPFQGYFFASTLGVATQGSGTWMVDTLFGYVARDAMASKAQQALETMVKSYHFNPQWMAGQQEATMRSSQIVAQAGRQIHQMLMDTFQHTSEVRDDVHRKWDNYIRGVVDVRDPETGQTYEVASGSNYYWLNPADGTYAATRTDTVPNTNFRQLEQY